MFFEQEQLKMKKSLTNLRDRLIPSGKGIPLESSLQIETEDVAVIGMESVRLIGTVRRQLNDLRKRPAALSLFKPEKLAVIVPYRNRKQHLERFVPHISAHLEEQQVSFQVVVIEQLDELPFNRAALLNAGARACREEFDAFCFHDVDFLPQEVKYRCGSQPLSLVSHRMSEETLHYGAVDPHFFGGVVIISRDQFFEVNGFSNRFWGWGGEDDNFLFRCLFAGLQPCRRKNFFYRELSHLHALESDICGNTGVRDVLRRNWENHRRGKRYQSMVKRGLAAPFADGVSELSGSSFEVDPIARVRRIGVDLGPTRERQKHEGGWRNRKSS